MTSKNKVQDMFNSILEMEPYLVELINEKISSDFSSEELLKEVLKFLHLIAESGQKLTPSILIDDVWHEMILFTKFYSTFCNKHFGRFIHHHPGGKDEENRNNYRKTIQLYVLTFGKPEPLIWGEASQEISNDSDCGSCSS